MLELGFTYQNPCSAEHQRNLGLHEVCPLSGGFLDPGTNHDRATLYFTTKGEARAFFAKSGMDYVGHFQSRKAAVAAARKRNAEL